MRLFTNKQSLYMIMNLLICKLLYLIQMSQEVIDRVDDMIRKNNIKYKDQQSQKAYERALIEYEKQTKMELAKQYANSIKEGNRKAIQKAKSIRRKEQQQKRKEKKKPIPLLEQPKEEKKAENRKKMSQAELALANKTIEARAERLIQQQQLQKLNRKLQQQRKRTKLFQLNQKCKNIARKSTEKIVTTTAIEAGRMGVLKSWEDKAQLQIAELDGIIKGLSQQAHKGKPLDYLRATKQQSPPKQMLDVHEVYKQQKEPSDSSYPQHQDDLSSDQQQHSDSIFNLNTLIFQKSSEELLQMDYIPI